MFLVVTRNFPPDIGGMQMLMGGLSEGLSEHGPVKVFADEFANAEAHDNKLSINVHRIKGIKIFRKYRKANLVNEYINQNSNIRAIFFDHWKSLELINEKYLKKTIIFCLVHSKEINHSINSSINKRLIKSLDKANYIIANSNFTKKLSIKVRVNKEKLNIINPGINIPKTIDKLYKIDADNSFKYSNSSEESFPKIITVARLEKRKNHAKILMTIKNLQSKFPKIKYISIGAGAEKENLKKLCDELELKKNVIFFENISQKSKIALIASSNLFLMPSVVDKNSVEGFGISFMEAASYGVGSIGGKDGGASDAILHNKTGLICDGNDLNSIYNSIVDFFDDKKFSKFGKAALEFSENFHWNKIVKNYLKLIN